MQHLQGQGPWSQRLPEQGWRQVQSSCWKRRGPVSKLLWQGRRRQRQRKGVWQRKGRQGLWEDIRDGRLWLDARDWCQWRHSRLELGRAVASRVERSSSGNIDLFSIAALDDSGCYVHRNLPVATGSRSAAAMDATICRSAAVAARITLYERACSSQRPSMGIEPCSAQTGAYEQFLRPFGR